MSDRLQLTWEDMVQAYLEKGLPVTEARHRARIELADRLELVVQHLRSEKTWPDVYVAEVPSAPGLTGASFIGRFTVTLSLPWPG